MVIGPFLLPPMVFACFLGVIILMLLGSLLKRYIDPRFDAWVGVVSVMAFVAARIGFVFRHWDTYQENPLRILYIWQGGFEMSWAIVAAILSLLFLKTWRHRGIALSVLAVVVMVIYLVFSMTSKPAATQLPDIVLKSINGEMIDLSSHADDNVVINIWASWCAPCRREMPMLEQAVSEYPDVQFYFVNQGESEQLVGQYLENESLRMHDHVLLDPEQDIARFYQTLGTPVTLFFSKNKLLAQHIGEISAELLSDRLKQLKP